MVNNGQNLVNIVCEHSQLSTKSSKLKENIAESKNLFTFDRFQVFPNANDDVTFNGQVGFEAETLISEGQNLSTPTDGKSNFITSRYTRC